MDFESRIKTLKRLAESQTDDARIALRKELDRAITSISSETQYDRLENDIAVLGAISHRFSREVLGAILDFIGSIGARSITYSDQLGVFADRIAEYQNANTLIVLAIKQLEDLRYLESKEVLQALMNLSCHSGESVRKKAEGALTALARYDLAAFQHVGTAPQKLIVETLESISDHELTKSSAAVLRLMDDVLSPTMEGTAWTYQTLTISRGATPALPEVREIRAKAIAILRRLYKITTALDQKRSVISTLSEASRSHNIGGNANVEGMIAESTIEVLHFFRDLVATEPLQVLQKIESNSYWMFYHAGLADVKAAAKLVEQALGDHAEYGIYKMLIGFESIFVPWEEAASSDKDWNDTDKVRKEKAEELARSICASNVEAWRTRIILYAKTESDDLATFPIFYHFLESVAIAKPEFAIELVSAHAEEIERFLIPLLRGLWGGFQSGKARTLIEEWSRKGQYLYQSMKLFLDNDKLDRALVSHLLDRAIAVRDFQTVTLAASVAVSNFVEEKAFLIEELFLPAVRASTNNADANWVFDFWYRKQARKVISALDEKGIHEVLKNLRLLKKIDYHAEEVLSHIATSEPEIVLRFLCARFKDPQEREARLFDAIPYELHKLNEPLARIPAAAVRIVRESYDGNFGMFIFRGGRLLKTIFRSFPQEFEKELLDIVGSGVSEDLEFVLAILRNYKGQPFIHGVAKAVIKAVPSDSKYQNEVAIALMTTGVVSGPYGFAEAYERKKTEVNNWLTDSDEKIRTFAKRYVEELDKMIAADRKRADEDIVLRKHRYGE